MNVRLVIRLPASAARDGGPFRRVAGVPVLTRLMIQGTRAGVREIVLVGDLEALEQARGLVERDPRLRALSPAFVPCEPPATAVAVIEATAEVVASQKVWNRLARADGARSVPGAPGLRRRARSCDDGSETPLWEGEAPDGCWAMPVCDGPGELAAKDAIFRMLGKRTTGWLARRFYSRLSLPVSRLLVHTPLTPNQMTVLHTLIGLWGAACLAVGSSGWLCAGGLLLLASATLDFCDGEIARCKLMESKAGELLDTACDHAVHVATLVGLTMGYARFAQTRELPWAPEVLPVGLGVTVLLAALVGAMFAYVRSFGLGGQLSSVAKDFQRKVRRAGPVYRLLNLLRPLGERNQFTLLIAGFTAAPLLTGSALPYHVLFGGTMAIVIAAVVYFAAGLFRTRTIAGS